MSTARAWKPAGLVMILVMGATCTGCIGMAAQLLYVIKGHQTPAAYDGLKDQRVAVVCVSDAASYGPDTLTYTINKAVSLKLANSVKKIRMVPPSEIESWLDVNGWGEYDFLEIGRGVEADKVVAIEIGRYSIREGNTLYKGRSELTVSVYDIKKGGQVVYANGPREYSYPQNGRPAIQTTDRKFELLYLSRLTENIASQFYPHDSLDTVAEDAIMND